VAEKKKKVDDMLNVKILAGFAAFLLIGSLVALSYLGERISAVNIKVKEYGDAATKLDGARGQLEQAVNDATKVYKQATLAPDSASQMQVLTALVTRIDGDSQRIDGELQKFKKNVAPLLSEYAAAHPKKTGNTRQ
jgi:ribosomal protein L14